ncbi:hypothetical protein KXD40_000670 [Peronospora effusa]|nr:hypothetical protein KXD40_000670 [Peronospora effusa]
MTHVLNFVLLRYWVRSWINVDESHLPTIFTHHKALKTNQLADVEAICDDVSKQQLNAYIQTSVQAKAKRISICVPRRTRPFIRVVLITILPMLESLRTAAGAISRRSFSGAEEHLRSHGDSLHDLTIETKENCSQLQAELDDIDKLDGIEPASSFTPVIDQVLILLQALRRVHEHDHFDGQLYVFFTNPDTNKTAAFTQVGQHHIDTKKRLDAYKGINHAMVVMKEKEAVWMRYIATGQVKTIKKVAETMTLSRAFI